MIKQNDKEMERTVSQWANCSPKAMATMSPAAIEYAFQDAKKDILRMAKILEDIAYPKRGSKEALMEVTDFADLIQKQFPLEFLSTKP